MEEGKLLQISKPILFKDEMVRAILDGRKTVTRRAIKQYVPEDAKFGYTAFTPDGCISARGIYADGYGEKFYRLPYHPSGYLYVRETFAVVKEHNGHCEYGYKADNNWSVPAWKPSIHMPKEAARIFLRVTDVKVERLQEITDKGAEAEGIPTEYPMDSVYCPRCKGLGMVGTYHPDSLGYMDVECPDCASKIVRFENLWNSTIKPADRDKYGWEANPWVFVIEFEKINPSEVK